jgi:hypothetical protein
MNHCTSRGVQRLSSVRDPVERADPQRPCRDPEQPLDAPAHLACCLVGEGDGEYPVGRGPLGLDEPGDAVGQHARLAAAGSREHQHRAERGRDGGTLRLVQRIEDRR